MKSESCFEELFERSLTEGGRFDVEEYLGDSDRKSIEAFEHDVSFHAGLFSNPKCRKCKGRNGIPKKIYGTRDEAIGTADTILWERGANLKEYRCAEGNGWHLTKDS